jgi:hypothetical protein
MNHSLFSRTQVLSLSREQLRIKATGLAVRSLRKDLKRAIRVGEGALLLVRVNKKWPYVKCTSRACKSATLPKKTSPWSPLCRKTPCWMINLGNWGLRRSSRSCFQPFKSMTWRPTANVTTSRQGSLKSKISQNLRSSKLRRIRPWKSNLPSSEVMALNLTCPKSTEIHLTNSWLSLII